MVETQQDPYLALADHALAQPSTPQEDPYLALADKALADQGAGVGDYAKLGVRGLMKSVIEPASGMAALGDTLARKANQLAPGTFTAPPVAQPIKALSQYEPTVNPQAEQSTLGKIIEGGTQALGAIGQTLLAPEAVVGHAMLAGEMGAQAFGQGQERALAAGASQDQADKAGFLNIGAGLIQALPVGRAAAVLGRAEKLLTATRLGGAVKGAAEFTGAGVAASLVSDAIQKSINSNEDEAAMWKAVKDGLIPQAAIGFVIGGLTQHAAEKSGVKLSEQAKADLLKAGEAVAAEQAKSPEANSRALGESSANVDVPNMAPGEPQSGIRDASGELRANPSTRIEVPDEATQGAVDRFKRDIKRKGDLEVHEASDAARAEAAKLGMRTVMVDAGEQLPASGYYDKETRTSVIDRNAGPEEQLAELRRHEIQHFMEAEHPDLAKQWSDALDEIAPGWQKEAGKETNARRRQSGLPGLSVAKQAEEGRAEAAQGLSTAFNIIETRPELAAQVIGHNPGLFRLMVDASIAFARKLGLTDRVTISEKIAALDKGIKLHGSEFEKKIGAQAALKLAKKLSELHKAMHVEEPTEQPRANEKPQSIKPSEPMGGNGEDVAAQPAFNPSDEQLTSRENLKKGMSADDAARALDAIDRRIENALVRGEGPKTPRVKQLARDRALAEKLIYESDPNHRSLAKEDPLSLWARIVKGDEANTEARAKELEKRGIKQTPDVAEAEQRQREAMRVAAERERAFQKMLRESKKQERAAAKEAKKPSKPKFDMAEAEKRGEEHARRLAEAKAKEAPKEEKPAPKTFKEQREEAKAKEAALKSEPKKKLPVKPRRAVMEDERVHDPLLGAHLEGMASEAGLIRGGGEKDMPVENMEKGVNYARMKRIPKAEWWNDRPKNFDKEYKEAETKDIVRRARAGEKLTGKERDYVTWMLDRAEADLYGPNATPEDIQKARDFYLEGSGMRTEPGEDAPFALPKKRLTDAEIEQRIKDEMAAQEKLDIVHAATYRKTLDRVYAEKDNPEKFRGRTPYGERVEAFAKANSSNPVDRERIRFALHTGDPLSGMTDREYGLIRLFVERENSMSQAERESMPKFEMKPSADVEAYNAERKIQNDWLGAFQKALRAGSSDAEAAKVANEAFPDALRPARFLAGLESPAFALPKKKGIGEGGDMEDFLRRYVDGPAHYAVTTSGAKTNQLRATAEEFFQKTVRTETEVSRGARELLASKAGKAEVDAFLRGEFSPPREMQDVYTRAGENRVNALLRAADNGSADQKKATSLAVDYFMLRSQQGRDLRVNQRPRTPSESFYANASTPAGENAEALRKLQNQLQIEDRPERIAKIHERIDEIKAKEAERFEQGMLALKKAGIDPNNLSNSAMATHAYKVFATATSKYVDWAVELRASSMVSLPATITSSFFGNVANVGWNTVLLRLAELPFKDGATTGEIKALTAAIPDAWQKGINAFMNTIKTGAPGYETQLKDLGLLEHAQSFENSEIAKIPGKFGNYARAGLTAMTSVDEFMRAMGSELEAVALAHRRTGGDPAKMEAALRDPKIWKEAVENTRRSIFQERENNQLVKIGFNARAGLDRLGYGKIPVGHLFFPFVQTGVNGFLEGLRKLPGPAQLISLSHLVNGEYKTNPELKARDKAVFVVSAIIAMTAWQLANAKDDRGIPWVTGSGEQDPAHRALNARTAPPMSFRVGDQWYSYSRMMPFALTFSQLVDAAQHLSPWDMVKGLGRRAVDDTFLHTLAGIFDWTQSDKPASESRDAAIRDFVTSFVPNAVSGAIRATDSGTRTDGLRKSDAPETGIAAGIMSRIGMGGTAHRYDPWGRRMDKGGSFITRYFSPVLASGQTENLHPADEVIRAWNAHVPEGQLPWAPQDAPYWYRSKGVTHYMSDKQFEEFQKRAGEIASSMLDERSLDPQHPTKQQIDRIKKVISRSRIQARREVLRDIPIDEDLE